MSTVTVKLWGVTIGMLGYSPDQTEVATFEYDKEFVEMGISPSPLQLPTSARNYIFEDISRRTFHGVPGFIADSLPDKFGNQLIDIYFAQKAKTSSDITTLDRLLYVGKRAMGALEYEPSESEILNKADLGLDIDMLSELADMILQNQEDFRKKLNDSHNEQAIDLLRIGSSAGGARAKALVAMDNNGKLYDGTVQNTIPCKYYLLKFDSSNNSDRDNKDPKGATRVEYIYSLIARECKIDIPDTTYIEHGEDFHFLIERFDRIPKENKLEKLHYVSWCGMAHADRDTTGAYSYEQLVMTARGLGLGQDAVEQIFRRAVFNIVGRNQDDHTKNFGFLMDKEGEWSLAPAFDMTYAYDPTGAWTKVHQISLAGKQSNFTLKDLILFGNFCNVKEKEVKQIVEKTIEEFKKFSTYADQYKVDEKLLQMVMPNLRVDL